MKLEDQMRELAGSVPVPTAAEDALANDEVIMEIREELDEDDNVINASVTPQDSKALGPLSSILSHMPASVPDSSERLESASEVEPVSSKPPIQTNGRSEDQDLEPPPVPTVSKEKKVKKKKKKTVSKTDEDASVPKSLPAQEDEEAQGSPISDHIIEHDFAHQAPGHFNIRETSDGGIEITDDPQGYSIGILPQGLQEMTDIVNEMDWENEDDGHDEEEESEDEFGRTKHRGKIPLPGLLSRPCSSQESRSHLVEYHRRHSADPENIRDEAARGKKKLVFADDLVQGPTTATKTSPPKSVLKKITSYPLTDEYGEASPPVTPTIAMPKQSRFKLQRSSTDTRIASLHARPSAAYLEKMNEAVGNAVVERITPGTKEETVSGDPPPSMPEGADVKTLPQTQAISNEEREQLFPRKINLAGVDLHPEDGTVKAALSIPKMSEEQLAAIRKKRELLGKKHKRRKSADPSYPVRSSSWDESLPVQKPHRRPSSGEDEQLGETFKAAKLARAKELLKAQDDIAWANSPVSPDEQRAVAGAVEANPLAIAGEGIKHGELQAGAAAQTGISGQPQDIEHETGTSIAEPVGRDRPAEIQDYASPGTSTPPNQENSGYAVERIHSPRPRKPSTPERRNSYTNIPSPLRQEIQPHSVSKEVQFTSDVIKKLEPLMENESEPTVVSKDMKERKMPPKRPSRKSSVDPQNVTPTPGSPPPGGRQPGPLLTEGDGSVSHYMVRATSKSPPPHIAIHDLVGHTPDAVRLALKEEAVTPTPRHVNGEATTHETEIDPMQAATLQELPDNAGQDAMPAARNHRSTSSSSSSSKAPVNGIVEHTHHVETGGSEDDSEVDEDLHRKEIAHEYHRLRQRMIGAEGGYVREEDGPTAPLDDQDPGPGQRVSRFKAARLGRRGGEAVA